MSMKGVVKKKCSSWQEINMIIIDFKDTEPMGVFYYEHVTIGYFV